MGRGCSRSSRACAYHPNATFLRASRSVAQAFPSLHIPCRLDLAPDTIGEVHIDLALPSQS